MPGKKKKYMITEVQEQAVDTTTQLIKGMWGGKNISVFRSLTGVVRIQDMRNTQTQKHTRMFCIKKNDSPAKITKIMMKYFEEIRALCKEEGKDR